MEMILLVIFPELSDPLCKNISLITKKIQDGGRFRFKIETNVGEALVGMEFARMFDRNGYFIL